MRTSAAFFASVLVIGALTPLACTQDFGIFEPSGASSSGTGGTPMTTSTTTTTSSTGGTGGGAPECAAGDACSDQNPCTADKCDAATGKCAHDPVPDGPSADGMDTPKDCHAPACVGGVLMQAPSATDVPDDSNPCTSDTCDNGTPKNTNLGPTTSCGANLYCDGNGACVGCVNANQCKDPGTCEFATCENGQCKSNNTPAGDEDGNDCDNGDICDGAGNCVECLDDSACTGTRICINNQCTTSCNTGVKDGTETDVDCGGLCMANCAVGKMCKSNGDCTSNLCTNNVCTAAPSCNDGTKNGSETDIDCGGSCATKCATGKMCMADGDCVSADCTNNVCVAAAPTCTDGVKNGTETDIDCGGSACGPCANAKKCVASSDCLSLSCIGTTCIPTQCSDNVKNGTETSIDCGGTCTKCTSGKPCLVNTDCLSGTCLATMACQ